MFFSSVSMTKSAVSLMEKEETLNGKLHFLWSETTERLHLEKKHVLYLVICTDS